MFEKDAENTRRPTNVLVNVIVFAAFCRVCGANVAVNVIVLDAVPCVAGAAALEPLPSWMLPHRAAAYSAPVSSNSGQPGLPRIALTAGVVADSELEGGVLRCRSNVAN